jgi:parvulin-like peptidyl-prolyl isomerase
MRFLKDPLTIFLAFGLLVFVGERLIGTDGDREAYRIDITQGQQQRILDQWQTQMGRPPTPEEAAGLLDQWLREEIFYREARALGLDENDTIIRRRLAQKLTFLNEDLANAEPPGQEELEEYFEANLDRYRLPDRYSFEHVYFSSDRREDARADALAEIDSAAPTGDPFILQKTYADRSVREIGDLFGAAFAEALQQLDAADTETWQGPIESAYGWHLIRLGGHTPGRDPLMAEVADAVQRDFLQMRRRDANEAFYRSLRERYDIRFEDAETDESGEPGV